VFFFPTFTFFSKKMLLKVDFWRLFVSHLCAILVHVEITQRENADELSDSD
jgi:hypothetical protein